MRRWIDRLRKRARLEIATLAALLALAAGFAFIFQASILAYRTDGRIVYGQGTTTSPQNRLWDHASSIWGGATGTPSANQPIRWTVNQASLARLENVAGVLTGAAGNPLYIQRWNGSIWSAEWNVNTAASNTRSFDVAYEESSGRTMVVYSTGTNMEYRVWNPSTTSWSAPASVLTAAESGNVGWVELVSRPGSNEIALLYAWNDGTTGYSLRGIVWNGSSWDNANKSAVLEANLAYNGVAGEMKAFDSAYENGGDLLVVFGRDANAAGYYVTKPAGGAWGAATAVGTWSDEASAVSLAAEPGGDRVVAVTAAEDTQDMQYGVWDGAAWSGLTVNADNSMYNFTSWSGKMPVAAGWVSTGASAKAIVVYADNAAGVVNWRSWTPAGGWVNETDWTPNPNTIGYSNSIDIDRQPGENKLMVTIGDTNGDLWAKTYDGTAWSDTEGGAALETNLSNATASTQFDFTYDRYAAVIAGNGSDPSNKTVGAGSTNIAVDAFTLSTSSGIDSVTGLTFTGNADFNSTNVTNVRLYRDAGVTPNEWDATDSLVANGALSGNDVTFSALSESVTKTPGTQYLIVFDVAGSAGNTTVSGTISAAAATNAFVDNDTSSATVTINTSQVVISDIGVGQTVPSNRTVGRGYTNQSVDAFSLKMTSGSDSVTSIVVDGSGSTNLADVQSNGVKIYRDVNNDGLWDAADSIEGTGSFSGSTATIPVSISVTTSEVNYIIAYDITTGAVNGDQLVGKVGSLGGASNPVTNNDSVDATLTIDAQAPATVANFAASDGESAQSTLTWTNPSDSDLAEVIVMRKTGSYPASHTDGTQVYQNTSPTPGGAVNTVNGSLTNGTTYYYAVFTRDSYGNWNDAVDQPPSPQSADTGSPVAVVQAQFYNFSQLAPSTVYRSQGNVAMMRFTLKTDGGSTTWNTIKIDEYGSGVATENVQTVKLYRDDGNGIFNAGSDTQLAITPTAFSGESTTFTITGGEAVTSTAKNYFIVYDIKSTATIGATAGARVFDDSYIGISSGVVTGVSNFTSGTPSISGDIVDIFGVGSAPSEIANGQTGVKMLDLTASTNHGTASMTAIKIFEYGNGTATNNVSAVKIYRDNGDGLLDTGSDTLLSTSPTTFTSETTTFTFPAETITTTMTNYFIVYDISASAPDSSKIGAQITDTSFITVDAPNAVTMDEAIRSGLANVNASQQVTVTSQAIARGSITVGRNYVALQSLTLKTNSGTASWTALAVNEFGSATATNSVANFYLVKETNGRAGYQSPESQSPSLDTVVATAPDTFETDDQTFTLSTPETINTTGATYYLVYTVKSTATVGTTLGSKLANQASIAVTSPASVAAFSNLSSSPLTIVSTPHSSFTSTTNLCQTCHSVHLAPDFANETTLTPGTSRAILNKAYLENPDVVNGYDHKTYNLLCESCHDGTGANSNIKGNYEEAGSWAGHQTQQAGALTTGWKAPPSGKQYNAGTKIPCMVCHDAHASTRGNYKMLADDLYGYETSPTGGNWTDPTADGKATDGGEACLTCHPKSNEASRSSKVLGIQIPALPGPASLENHDSKNSCNGCHVPHNPTPPAPGAAESSGGAACSGCHSFYNDMKTNTAYHHYMVTDAVGYPTLTPSGTYTIGDTDTNRSCLMCHVDHDYFKTGVNPTNPNAATGGRARNLRSAIQVSPLKTDLNTYLATDFLGTSTYGGICMSCHGQANFTKSANRKSDGSTKTPLLNKDTYNASVHNYSNLSANNPSSSFLADGSSYTANCGKCHNETRTLTTEANKFQDPAGKRFAVHDADIRHILTDNGTAAKAETTYNSLEENFCYLCHGAVSQDIYGIITMPNNAKNLNNETNKAYSHQVATVSGNKHQADEGVGANEGWMPSTKRHIECEDCHSAHGAQRRSPSTRNRPVTDDMTNFSGVQISLANVGTWGLSYSSSSFTSYTGPGTLQSVSGNTVTGSSTTWATSGVGAGWYFAVSGTGPGENNNLTYDWYLVESATNTQLTIRPAWGGGAITAGTKYFLMRINPTVMTLSSGSTNYEYSVCLKCHTKFAWGNTAQGWNDAAWPAVTPIPQRSGFTGGSWKASDIALDFTPEVNYAYHPIFKPGRNQPAAGVNAAWTNTGLPLRLALGSDPALENQAANKNANGTYKNLNNTFTDGWFAHSFVTCTDCHDSDSSSIRGPHGSARPWMLKKADVNAGVTLASGTKRYTNSSTWPTTPPASATRPNNFCTNCHRGDVYGLSDGSGTNSPDNTADEFSRLSHASATSYGSCGDAASKSLNPWGIGCMNCHGGNEPGGIHGSARGKGQYGADIIGKRFMNGASWNGHSLGEQGVSGSGTCYTKESADQVNNCTQHKGSQGGKTYTPNYNATYSEP